jgi:signal transduction histidine kinase
VPVPTPADIVADRVVEVRHSGDLLGALAVTKQVGDSFRPAETKLLDDVAAQAGLVLRNVRLVEELRGSRERLMSSQDDERRRLERRLHDGAQARLLTVGALINDARGLLGPEGEDSSTALDELAGQLQAANEELNELARGIHPAVLTELGLGPAMRALADRAPVPVGVDVQLDHALSRNAEATLYFVASEALTNVAKYAHATSVVLTLGVEDGSAVLEVTDDGIGGVDETRGSGVRGLRDRVSAVDGSLEIFSPPGAGTRLRCLIPLRASTGPTPTRTDDLALAARSGR